MDGQIAIIEIRQKYVDKTPQDRSEAYLLRLDSIKQLFGSMTLAIMNALPAGAIMTASATPSERPERYITIGAENGLAYHTEYSPGATKFYHPLSDQWHHIGSLDLLVMVPHVCAAGQQVIAYG